MNSTLTKTQTPKCSNCDPSSGNQKIEVQCKDCVATPELTRKLCQPTSTAGSLASDTTNRTSTFKI